MERGAIILFERGNSLHERLIVWATHGIYVHCEICLGEERLIGAHGDKRGIYERDWADSPQLVTTVSLSAYADADHIERALTWAQEQQGRPYGWMDIASQAIKFMWPTTPLRLARDGAWDCSSFVCRYLQQAGIVMPDDFDNPDQVTPNDIGRIFHLVKERPQRTKKREREKNKGHIIAEFATERGEQ